MASTSRSPVHRFSVRVRVRLGEGRVSVRVSVSVKVRVSQWCIVHRGRVRVSGAWCIGVGLALG